MTKTRVVTKRPEIDPHLGAAFSVREARALGITASRLRASDLSTLFSGSRLRADIPAQVEGGSADMLRQAAAYVPVAPTAWAFSHVTAARLYGMPLPLRLRRRRELDVAVPPGTQPPRRAGVTGHRMAGFALFAVGGFPVVEPERVWLQLAPLLSLDELVVAGDFLVRRKRPRSSMEALARGVDGAHGARGIRRAHDALDDVRPGTDSPPESWVRLTLVRAGLPEPLVRHTVIDDDGYFVGTPDLAYPVQRIAIEYEGEDHRSDPQIFEDDIDRREMFRRAGWLVILVTKRKLRRPGAVVSEVADALRERGLLR